MKLSLKRQVSLLLVLCLALALTACAAPAGKSEAGVVAAAPAEAASEAADARVITDALGREVTIPVKVERIVPLGNATRMCTYLGLQDKFVTITQSDLNETPFMAYGYFNREAWSALPIAASGGYGVFHPEVILEADPDLILCTYEADIVADLEAQTGLPVVAVAQGKLFAEDYDQALRILGDACGVRERADQVVDFIHACLDDLSSRTGDIPAEDKPLILGAAATFRGGHGINGVYVDSPILQAISAHDAAVALEKNSFDTGVEVDREQILVWDPELIILDAGNLGLVNAEYAESPDFFEQLRAFEAGQLYQWPNSTANYTNVEIPLVSAYYLGSILYPQAFADVDFEAKAAEIFGFFLGRDGYLQVLNDNGCGYGPVALGE